MEWKSFVDEKPEIGNWVFICSYFDRYNIDVNLTQSYRIPTVGGTGGKLATHWMYIPEPPKPKRTYPAPKAGTIVTEENLNEFIEKYSFWLVLQGIDDGYYLSRYDGEDVEAYVEAYELQRGNNLPYQVKRVEDTNEIKWKQEEL